jgi:hypothetical protein
MENVTHWTQQSTADFVYGIAATFVAQIETKMEEGDVSRSEIAKRLNRTSGRVSQILNNPGNLGLKVMVETAGSLGMKVGVIAYDDHDPTNGNGPIDPDVFVKCWERAGRPASIFEVEDAFASHVWEGYLSNVIGSDISNTATGKILGYNANLAGYVGGVAYIYPTVKTVEPVNLLPNVQVGASQIPNLNEPWRKPCLPEFGELHEIRRQQESPTTLLRQRREAA